MQAKKRKSQDQHTSVDDAVSNEADCSRELEEEDEDIAESIRLKQMLKGCLRLKMRIVLLVAKTFLSSSLLLSVFLSFFLVPLLDPASYLPPISLTRKWNSIPHPLFSFSVQLQASFVFVFFLIPFSQVRVRLIFLVFFGLSGFLLAHWRWRGTVIIIILLLVVRCWCMALSDFLRVSSSDLSSWFRSLLLNSHVVFVCCLLCPWLSHLWSSFAAWSFLSEA